MPTTGHGTRANFVVADMLLTLGTGMHDLVPPHWTSENNVLADKISRVALSAAVPELFSNAQLAVPTREQWTLL